MNTNRRRLIVLCLAMQAAFLGHAQTQVSVSASSNMATIGDRIQIKIIAKTERDVDGITIDIPGNEFVLVSRQDLPMRTLKGSRVFETNLFIAFFRVGEYTLGPFAIHLLRGGKEVETRETNSLPLTVKSVLKESDRDIQSLKSPIPVPGNPFHALKYVLAALALLGLIVFFILRVRGRKHPRPKAVEPPPSPLERLETDMGVLWGKLPVAAEMAKPFFIQLSEAVKRFLGGEYGFNAEDLTSRETLSHLEKVESETRIHHHLGAVMQLSDLVKFAKHIPAAADYGVLQERMGNVIAVYRSRRKNEETEEHVPSGQ